MSNNSEKNLIRLETGGLPIIHWVIKRMRLTEILTAYIPAHGNEIVSAIDSLLLMLYNITIGRQPLYELEQWAKGINPKGLGRLGIAHGHINDDRFGRALDKLYWADRSSLMTEIVIKVIEEFKLDISRIHNDSTTIKAFGHIPGKTRTGLELKKGKSKDHRPDLKQLVYCLSISADGAVPIHHKVYAGNRTDDTTHIETWNTIRRIVKRTDFLYVADCKVCTNKQLSHIVGLGGRVVTIIPETWKEVEHFKDELRSKIKAKKKIWRRKIQPRIIDHPKYEYFSLFSRKYNTKQGYRIHWIYSNEKKQRDHLNRLEALVDTEKALLEINSHINTRKLKTREQIDDEIKKVVKKFKTKPFFKIRVTQSTEKWKVQIGRGRPGPHTKYRVKTNTIYVLIWSRDLRAIKKEQRIDGIFPLLSTDEKLSAKEVLMAYKYQPKLEKRFTQFKSVHRGAPLLFKKIERVESTMFIFFLALIIQALIEREVRRKMLELEIESLDIYPECRDAYHPTTTKILSNFEGLSVYKIMKGKKIVEEYKDTLSDTQKIILKLLEIEPARYWNPKT